MWRCSTLFWSFHQKHIPWISGRNEPWIKYYRWLYCNHQKFLIFSRRKTKLVEPLEATTENPKAIGGCRDCTLTGGYMVVYDS